MVDWSIGKKMGYRPQNVVIRYLLFVIGKRAKGMRMGAGTVGEWLRAGG